MACPIACPKTQKYLLLAGLWLIAEFNVLTSILVFIRNYVFVFRLPHFCKLLDATNERESTETALFKRLNLPKRLTSYGKVPRIFSYLNIVRKWIVWCKYFGSLPSNAHCSNAHMPLSANKVLQSLLILVFISLDNRKTDLNFTFWAGGCFSWHVGQRSGP